MAEDMGSNKGVFDMSSAEKQQVATAALWKPRLFAVVATVVAAVLAWVLAEFAFGVDLHSPGMGSQPSQPISGAWVAIVAAVVSLVGWAALSIMERVSSRARTWWTVLAVVVFALSLTGPWSGPGITTANRLLLMLIHLVVAAVLIPLLSRTSANKAT